MTSSKHQKKRRKLNDGTIADDLDQSVDHKPFNLQKSDQKKL
jgi:hypothetical protein